MRFARIDKAHTTPMASIIGRTGIDFVFLVEDMKLPSINTSGKRKLEEDKITVTLPFAIVYHKLRDMRC